MFRTIAILVTFLFFGITKGISQTSAQPGVISGTILDSITKLPIEYAAVGIADISTGKIVNGSMTDAQGTFRISDLPFGDYEVQINFIGYTPATSARVSLKAESPETNVGQILLSAQAQLLEEIKVMGEAALIEAKPDKIIYNAERDVTSAGGDASDVLRKVPLLTVDIDGNVSLRGSENIRILINGRPSGMFSDNVADALKMMPADQIKAVEVITSPSAKYDGEGTAGIINIVTKKKNIDGVAGSVNLTAGTRNNRANGNLNYGKGRFGLNISGGGHQNIPQTGSNVFLREETLGGDQSVLSQQGQGESSRLGYRGNVGVEYNFNEFNTLSAEISLRRFESKNQNDVQSLYKINEVLIDSYQRVVDGQSVRSGMDLEAEYQLRFPENDNELSFAAELDHDDNSSDFNYDQIYSFPDELVERETNLNMSDNLEMTFQADYTHAVSEEFELETGVKTTLREISSDFNYNTFDVDLNQWVPVDERTDIFYYDQNVYAGYISGTLALGKEYSIMAGVRGEITRLQGRFEEFNNPFDNNYFNLLPNVILSRKLGQFNQIKLSYNQRIQRPNQRHINPFIEYNDNRDISYGNPSLFPELVHQVELGTTFFIKGSMINASVFGRRTDDLIENLLTINDEGISESTFYNFGQRSAIGLNVFGSLNVGQTLSLRGGFDVNAWEVDGEFESTRLSNSGYDYNGRMNVTWSVNKSLKVEGFSYFRSPSFTVQGKNPSWSMMSFGLKQELFKKRLTIGLNFTEPFRENQNFIREIEGDQFYQYSKAVRPVRSFGINIGYNFGKLDFKERTGRKRENGTDLKPEDQPGDQPFQGN